MIVEYSLPFVFIWLLYSKTMPFIFSAEKNF